jgi:hypothetical protein
MTPPRLWAPSDTERVLIDVIVLLPGLLSEAIHEVAPALLSKPPSSKPRRSYVRLPGVTRDKSLCRSRAGPVARVVSWSTE